MEHPAGGGDMRSGAVSALHPGVLTVKLEPKDYSHFEAFGEGFSKKQTVMGFAQSRCPFVPRCNPDWEWPRAALRDLLVYWESGGSDGLYLFGPHGAGKS